MPKLFWLSLLFIAFSVCSYASGYVVHEILQLSPNTYEYRLQHTHIIHGSEEVLADSLTLLMNRDYSLDYRRGILYLNKLPGSGKVNVQYLIIPEDLRTPMFSYQPFSLTDSTTIALEKPNFFAQSSKLNISGSKTFALNFSESGETDLLQSLYVNLNGEISEQVSIEAQLSDSQSKLSPEGDSRELSSLDRVFIKVYSHKWEIGMGDLDFAFEDSRYLKYSTKLEGIAASYSDLHTAQAAFSAGGGKRASITLAIIDGKQGPYYLEANSFQRSFMVVAASEEIYLDGNLLERGTDYYIDYAEGSVMFRRLVSSANLVNVYFQYTQENYQQATYFESFALQLSPTLSLSHHLIHQNDAKDKSLLFELSDTDIDSLRLAGDNAAYSSGVIESESGSYILLTDEEGNQYYEYAYGDSLALYDLVFSYVGPGNGDYTAFSTGKYRWVGSGQGEYLPLKRLIPPVSRTNADLGVAYQQGPWLLGIDALYSYNDQNTYSSLDDSDNPAGIISLNLSHRGTETPYILSLAAQRRLANTYRFSSDGSPDYDLSALTTADSLAQSTVEMTIGYRGAFWHPEVDFRWRDLEHNYIQKALRVRSQSQAWGFLPAITLQSTLSRQDGDQASTVQFHNLLLTWLYKSLQLQLSGLNNRLDNDSMEDTQYSKLSPAISLNTQKSTTMLSYIHDESRYRITRWQLLNSSDTYSITHHGTYQNHSLDLDFSHRQLNNPQSSDQPKSSYELLRFSDSHKLFGGALNIINNYELNQTEFFPKIRDLVYVGGGLGVYDSTGVMIDDGDYIYEYITSSVGSLSTQINAISSIYLKPGLFLANPLWQRVQSDISFNATDQTDIRPSLGSYLFLPQYSFNSADTIYGRRSYLQKLLLDLYQGRIIALLSLELNRDLDRRYQETERTRQDITALQFDFKDFMAINTRLELSHELGEESRYDSQTHIYTALSSFEKNFNPATTAQLELSFSREENQKQSDAEENFELNSISIAPSLRSVLMQKYRVSARIMGGYNYRKGSDFLSYLPQKRKGFIADAQLLGIYRLNAFSSFSLEYRFGKYPSDKASHNLKLEFKAEL